jgi:hypothetical protein
LRWSLIQANGSETWSALGSNRPGEPYLDLSLSSGDMGLNAPANQVHFIVGRKMPPSVMRILMEALDLNHVSCPDTGDLVDPWGYDDHAPYFATKHWQEDKRHAKRAVCLPARLGVSLNYAAAISACSVFRS